MTILGIPNVGVLEPIDVHIEQVTRVEVHVGNEEMSDEPSAPPSFDSPTGELSGLYLIWDIEVRQPTAPIGCFFVKFISRTLAQGLPGATLAKNILKP